MGEKREKGSKAREEQEQEQVKGEDSESRRKEKPVRDLAPSEEEGVRLKGGVAEMEHGGRPR